MEDSIGRLIYLLLLLFFIGGYFFTSGRTNLGKTAQMALIWVFIFLGGVVVVGLWSDIKSGLIGPSVTGTSTELTIPRSSDGHFFADLEINGVAVEFLVDTGATDLVLTRKDAGAVGIDVANLAFLGSAQTANGTVETARTRLDRVKLGERFDTNVLASVNGGELDISLLGMAYLERFRRVELTSDLLVLHY